MVVDLVTWRKQVEAAGHIARSSAVDERPQVLLKNGIHWKAFNSTDEAVKYAREN